MIIVRAHASTMRVIKKITFISVDLHNPLQQCGKLNLIIKVCEQSHISLKNSRLYVKVRDCLCMNVEKVL